MVAVLRLVSVSSLFFMLMACDRPEISYETYIQVNRADSHDAKYVLVLVKNPKSLMGEPDISLATFTLRDPEKKSVINGNKHFPDHRYQFEVELDQGSLKVQVTVKHSETTVFQSVQTFNGSTIQEKIL